MISLIMIIGIGCDIVQHSVTEQLHWSTDMEMLKKILVPQELYLYSINQNIKFISGRYAAKEALLKCLGTGMEDGIALTDIQILQLKSGKPSIYITGEVKKIADMMKINSWHLSISHSTDYSYASVIAERIC